MLGETFFKKGYAEEFFEYSPIKYIKGQGKLFDGINEFLVEWELNVLITGNVFFVLSGDSIILDCSDDKHFKEWSLIGETDLGASISVENLYIYKTVIGDKLNSINNSYFCKFRLMNIIAKEFVPIDSIVGYIHNYHFSGRNFSCNITDHVFNFLQLEKDRELIDLYKRGITDKSFFSVICASLRDEDNLEEVIKIIDNILYLISLFSSNMTVVPFIKLLKNGNIVGYTIRNLTLFPYNSTREVIDNFYIRGGIKNAIEQCYDNYCNLEASLNLKTLINGLVAMMVQPFNDLKFAILLISYEFLLSKFLLLRGFRKEDIEKMNIQQKLYKVNEYLKFIPSRLLKDDLRENIRNPLFHQGLIPFMSHEEIYYGFKDYWELLIQILLKILNYSGEYLEPDSNNLKKVP